MRGVAGRVRLVRVAGPERGAGELAPFHDRPAVASASPTSAVATTAAPARLLAGRPMIDCTIQSEAPVTATAPAVCGTLEVPEDRSNPSGRMIGLRVAVIPAEADTPEPDAFFAVAGGPGRAGTAFFGWLPGLFADVHATRDIVLVDQRGTGGSNALVLPPMPDTTGLSQAEVDAVLQTWSDDWLASIEADPRQYTSSVAADDLDAVREALGYELIDLYGTSYGATLAQYYIRQHPDHVRVAIMDGGTPLDVPAFERMAANSQAALELLFDRCADDAACDAALPDLSTEWSELEAALAAGIDTGLTDPDSGEPVVATLDQVAPGIHQALLDPATAAQLPLAHPPRPRGAMGTGRRGLAGVDRGRRRLAGDERDHHVLGGVGAVRPGRGRTPRRTAATCCRRSSPRPRRGHNAARRFRRASYRPTMRRRSPPSCRSCGSPATATRRTRQRT